MGAKYCAPTIGLIGRMAPMAGAKYCAPTIGLIGRMAPMAGAKYCAPTAVAARRDPTINHNYYF